MAPPAALAAFKTKQIDGFAMSMPWPIGPVLDGEAIVIASGADGDPPDMVPFGMASLITKPATCEKRRSVCEKMGRAITEAANFLRDHPAEAMALLKKRFAALDDKVFAAGFEQIRKATPARPVTVRAALENGESYNVEAGLLRPEDRLKSYEGLYTEAFIPVRPRWHLVARELGFRSTRPHSGERVRVRRVEPIERARPPHPTPLPNGEREHVSASRDVESEISEALLSRPRSSSAACRCR